MSDELLITCIHGVDTRIKGEVSMRGGEMYVTEFAQNLCKKCIEQAVVSCALRDPNDKTQA